MNPRRHTIKTLYIKTLYAVYDGDRLACINGRALIFTTRWQAKLWLEDLYANATIKAVSVRPDKPKPRRRKS